MKKFGSLLLVAMLIMVIGVFPAAAKEEYEIAVIVKATDSDFWQYVLIGAVNAGIDNPNLKITTYGPPSEVDIEQQIDILENVITRRPDAIVISSTSSEASVPALEDAYRQGIKVITIDNRVMTDQVHSFLATDNIEAGGKAAEKLVELLKERNLPLDKTVAVIGSTAGVQVITDRSTGFIDRLKELAPNIQVPAIRYVDNDIFKTLNTVEDLLTAYGDEIVGFFAVNNITGDGLARVIVERNLHDKVVAVAFDSDPEEIAALRSGALDALVLQDPYAMGYEGVMYAYKAILGETLPEYVDTGAVVVTKEIMDEPHIRELLDPTLKKK